jgi:hypothetical protein
MSTEISPLEQTLLDTIQKSSAVTGEIYDGAKKVTGNAIDFAVEQIPDVIHQLLMWKFVHSLFLFCVFLSLLVFCIVFTYKLFTAKKGSGMEEAQPLVIFTIVGSLVSVAGLLASLTWIKIWVAPKLYLLEYAVDLARKMG